MITPAYILGYTKYRFLVSVHVGGGRNTDGVHKTDAKPLYRKLVPSFIFVGLSDV